MFSVISFRVSQIFLSVPSAWKLIEFGVNSSWHLLILFSRCNNFSYRQCYPSSMLRLLVELSRTHFASEMKTWHDNVLLNNQRQRNEKKVHAMLTAAIYALMSNVNIVRRHLKNELCVYSFCLSYASHCHRFALCVYVYRLCLVVFFARTFHNNCEHHLHFYSVMKFIILLNVHYTCGKESEVCFRFFSSKVVCTTYFSSFVWQSVSQPHCSLCTVGLVYSVW